MKTYSSPLPSSLPISHCVARLLLVMGRSEVTGIHSNQLLMCVSCDLIGGYYVLGSATKFF